MTNGNIYALRLGVHNAFVLICMLLVSGCSSRSGSSHESANQPHDEQSCYEFDKQSLYYASGQLDTYYRLDYCATCFWHRTVKIKVHVDRYISRLARHSNKMYFSGNRVYDKPNLSRTSIFYFAESDKTIKTIFDYESGSLVLDIHHFKRLNSIVLGKKSQIITINLESLETVSHGIPGKANEYAFIDDDFVIYRDASISKVVMVSATTGRVVDTMANISRWAPSDSLGQFLVEQNGTWKRVQISKAQTSFSTEEVVLDNIPKYITRLHLLGIVDGCPILGIPNEIFGHTSWYYDGNEVIRTEQIIFDTN